MVLHKCLSPSPWQEFVNTSQHGCSLENSFGEMSIAMYLKYGNLYNNQRFIWITHLLIHMPVQWITHKYKKAYKYKHAHSVLSHHFNSSKERIFCSAELRHLLMKKWCSEDKVQLSSGMATASWKTQQHYYYSLFFPNRISVKQLIASITAYVMQEVTQLFKGDIWLCASGFKEQTTKLYFLKVKPRLS